MLPIELSWLGLVYRNEKWDDLYKRLKGGGIIIYIEHMIQSILIASMFACSLSKMWVFPCVKDVCFLSVFHRFLSSFHSCVLGLTMYEGPWGYRHTMGNTHVPVYSPEGPVLFIGYKLAASRSFMGIYPSNHGL